MCVAQEWMSDEGRATIQMHRTRDIVFWNCLAEDLRRDSSSPLQKFYRVMLVLERVKEIIQKICKDHPAETARIAEIVDSDFLRQRLSKGALTLTDCIKLLDSIIEVCTNDFSGVNECNSQ
jgi:hypothetical protein